MHCDLECANNHEKEHSKQILVLKITGSENKRVAKGQDNLKQVNERGKFLKKIYKWTFCKSDGIDSITDDTIANVAKKIRVSIRFIKFLLCKQKKKLNQPKNKSSIQCQPHPVMI